MSGLDNRTAPPPGDKDSSGIIPQDASLITIIVFDTVVTLICGCIITVCVMWRLNKKSRRKEERDKLSHIIQVNYWENEDSISKVTQILTKMKQVIVFKEVTEMHVLAYKYRMDNGVYGPKEYANVSWENKLKQLEQTSLSSAMVVIRKIERLFEMLTIELPCQGKCPVNISAAFGSTVYTLAQNTSLLWNDHTGRLIRHIIHYFAGRGAAERFDCNLIADEDLETLVLARVPYVHQMYLNEDHFVLMDVEIISDLKVDLKNKIRYVDTVLAKDSKVLKSKEKNITEAYYASREICVKNNFIQNKSEFPDIVSKVGEGSKLGECVVYLRHLLRVMCITKNMKKLETDDKFFQFLMQLHESLYTWADTGTMVEIIERIRANIFCYLKGLTIEQMLLDKEFTKAKLEHFEKELYRHLNYLTLRQVQQERLRRSHPQSSQEGAVAGAAAVEPKLRTAGSDSSIYTMALSTSSYMMQRQASVERSERGHQSLELLHQQPSLDQSSVVSGSSMYATALSLSSGDGGIVRRSPPPQATSPPEPRSPATSRTQLGLSPPPSSAGDSHAQSPPPADPNEFCETAV